MPERDAVLFVNEAFYRAFADRDFEALSALRDTAPALGLKAEIGGRALGDIARDVLEIARGGLKARARLNAAGEDETRYLAPLDEAVASGRTLADELLARYNGEWQGDIGRLFRDYQY